MVRAAQEDKDKSVIDDIKERLLSKFDEINNNEITRNYIESKEKLDRLIKKLMMCWFIQFPAKSLVRQMTAVHAAAVEINLVDNNLVREVRKDGFIDTYDATVS